MTHLENKCSVIALQEEKTEEDKQTRVDTVFFHLDNVIFLSIQVEAQDNKIF